MKRFIAILILLVFVVSEFKPLIYLADYALNFEYISTELCIEKDVVESCCKGKCYLNEQLSKTVEDEDPTSERRTPKIEWEKTPMIIFPQEKIDFVLIEEEDAANLGKVATYFDDIHSKIPTPPPQV